MRLVIIMTFSLILASCGGGKNSTGYSIINDMIYPVTYEAYSSNPTFKNGQTNQLPVEGTVARGFLPHPVGADGSPEVLDNPYVVMTDYHWERGKKLYMATCSACHGAEGKGDGKVVTQGGFPAPPKFTARRFKYSKKDSYPAGRVYNTITFGQGNMPSHAQQLYPEDRWYVSEYVREKLMIKGKK